MDIYVPGYEVLDYNCGKSGHVMYFEMLKEYFFALSEAVIDYTGTIYQCAGDEMIVCWKLRDGLKRNNSIECLFAMKRALEEQEEKYKSKFGILPAFKPGYILVW